jgi:hypothetical protein
MDLLIEIALKFCFPLHTPHRFDLRPDDMQMARTGVA